MIQIYYKTKTLSLKKEKIEKILDVIVCFSLNKGVWTLHKCPKHTLVVSIYLRKVWQQKYTMVLNNHCHLMRPGTGDRVP